MLEAMTRMTSTLQGLGNRVRERSEDLNRAKDVNGNVDLKQAKRISNLIAEEMNSFAASMEVDVPVFGNSFSSAIDAYARAFTITKQLGVEKKEDVKTAKESIHQFNATLTQTQKDMASLRETVATAPRATTQLNRAKKRTVSILDRLDEEFTKASNLSSEMEKLFDQF